MLSELELGFQSLVGTFDKTFDKSWVPPIGCLNRGPYIKLRLKGLCPEGNDELEINLHLD